MGKMRLLDTKSANPAIDGAGNFVLYDGDCPVCQNYIAWTRLKVERPDIRLIDAREAPDLVSELRNAGIEVNDSMVLQLDEQLWIGVDAMSCITSLSRTEPSLTSTALKSVLKGSVLQVIYPLLVRCRKILLWLLGRKQI